MAHFTNLVNRFIGDEYHDLRAEAMVNPTLKTPVRDASKIKRVVFHCTDSSGWTPDRLMAYHIDERKWPRCGYHFYVQPKKVWHLAGDTLVTYHAAPFNTESIAFSIDFFPTHDEPLHIPVDGQTYTNAVNLAALLCLSYKVPPLAPTLVGHRELPMTGWFKGKNDQKVYRKSCPGFSINLDVFRFEVTKRVQAGLNEIYNSMPFGAYEPLVLDGIFGPKTKRWFNHV